MNFPSYAQLHLALTHLPVVAVLFAAVTLAIGALTGARATRRFGLVLLVVAGLSAVPAYLTGEGAEEIVEDRPGVAESVIERHEEAAESALALVLAGAAVAAGALLAARLGSEALARALFLAALAASVADAAVLARVAHLGGQIRHDEIRVARAGAGPSVAWPRGRSDDD